MPKKQITVSLKRIDDGYWQTVREFCVHRKMTNKAMVLLAVDQYMARHKEKERKQRKEDKS